MGKKNKPFKMKQYKVPPEKFLVVVNPWGIYGNFDMADFNHVGAWFEVMLRDEYPNTRVRAIYFQRTHRNIIVELPKEVDDFEQYLGTHKHSEFFIGATQSKEVSFIYEYKYATFGDPTEKTFAIGHPMYDVIAPDLPIKYPYPLSSPAPPPPMDVPYARAIRPEVNERLADRHRDRPEPDNFTTTTAAPESIHPGPSNDRLLRTENPPSASQSAVPNDKGKGKEKEIVFFPESSEVNFTPYVRPGHLNSKLNSNKAHEHKSPSIPGGKLDPYEEDNCAETLLRSKPPADGDDAQKFLDSILYSVKTEEHSELPGHAGETKAEYVPSAELLEALRMLPSDLIGSEMVKAEEIEPNIKDEPTDINLSDYQPSEDLLAALATLPADMTPPGQLKENPVKQEPLEDDFRIKQEPLDFTGFEMSSHHEQQPKPSNEANSRDTARGSSSSKREIKYETKRDPPKRMKFE